MTKSGINEEFWFLMMNNTKFFSRYYLSQAVTASMQAHAIGRVTCPDPGGAGEADITSGFWNKARIGVVGEQSLKITAIAAATRLRWSQCKKGPWCCNSAPPRAHMAPSCYSS